MLVPKTSGKSCLKQHNRVLHKENPFHHLQFQILDAQLHRKLLGDLTAEPDGLAIFYTFGGQLQEEFDRLVVVDALASPHHVTQAVDGVRFAVLVGRTRICHETYLKMIEIFGE